jgi:hypothetical protein
VASANPQEACRSGSSRALVNDRSWRCADHTDTAPIAFRLIASVCFLFLHISKMTCDRPVGCGAAKTRMSCGRKSEHRREGYARHCLRLRANQQPRTAPLEISFADVNPNVNVKSNSVNTTTTTTKSLSNRPNAYSWHYVTCQASCHINS